jgi:integrase
MRGSIHKHTATDGRITWRVRIDTTDPQSGVRHQPQRTFGSKREAERGLRDWLHELDQGQAVYTERRTVGQYLDWWLSNCAQHRVKPTTLASYTHLIGHYITPHVGTHRLDKLTAQHIQSFYTSSLARGLGHRTVRYCHSVLHNALRDAVRLQMVGRNVAEAVTPPRAIRHEAQAWTPEEAQRFLRAARSDALWPLWLLALHTGLRRSELLGLRWSDAELGGRREAGGESEGGRLSVRQSVVLAGNDLLVQPGAKRGGHPVSIDHMLVAALREHRTRQLEMRMQLGPLWTDHDLIVTAHDGGPAHPTTVRRHLMAIEEQAGVPHLPFHGLRHTHATILMLSGVHPKVVSERLGHADIGITLRTYSHVLPTMEAQAAEIFAAAVAAREDA